MLIISMVVGAGIYLIYHEIPQLHPAGPVLLEICHRVQPAMLFAMLFLSFCKVEPRDMRPHRWMVPLLLIQCGSFAAITGLVLLFPQMQMRIPLESFMLCMICPTATACAVVTRKLGGDMAGVVTYTILINLAVALVAPALLPLIYPFGGLSFGAAFVKILSKVFPLLIMPCLSAWLLRRFFPKAHGWLLSKTEWSFYIWAISLSLAILMSTRAIVCSSAGARMLFYIALASLVSCALQFYAGKKIGARWNSEITAGQALGQKNTVFAIWMGYTFLDPVVSIAGGFYSLWHNIYNSYQLKRKSDEVQA